MKIRRKFRSFSVRKGFPCAPKKYELIMKKRRRMRPYPRLGMAERNSRLWRRAPIISTPCCQVCAPSPSFPVRIANKSLPLIFRHRIPPLSAKKSARLIPCAFLGEQGHVAFQFILILYCMFALLPFSKSKKYFSRKGQANGQYFMLNEG